MGTIEKKLIREENLTIYSVQGAISGVDVKNAITEFYDHGPVTKYVLWDVSQADLENISAEDVQQIGSVPRKSLEPRKGGKTAIVAPDDLAFGLSRMYQNTSLSEPLPFETQVFRDLETARNWLAGKSSQD